MGQDTTRAREETVVSSRTGARYTRTYYDDPCVLSGAVVVGMGVGLVGAALTGTVAACRSFERGT